MTADNVHRQARAISSDLARVQIEEIEAKVGMDNEKSGGK
jgi:hypothetical protein